MSDQGTGITITFDTGFFGTITSMTMSGITRESIDVTTFATSGGKEFVPSDLYDMGSLDIEMLFAPATAPNVLGDAAESCTVTWSDSGATTWAASAFMTNYAPSATDAEGRNTASASLKFSGDLTIV
jgi:hypothetical protein